MVPGSQVASRMAAAVPAASLTSGDDVCPAGSCQPLHQTPKIRATPIPTSIAHLALLSHRSIAYTDNPTPSKSGFGAKSAGHGHLSASVVPIVPYLQHGGGQVPLQALLPSSLPSSPIPSIDVPEYTPITTYSPHSPAETPDAALDAPDAHILPTIDIPIEHFSQAKPSAKAPTSLGGTDDSLIEDDSQMKGRKHAIAAAGTFFGLFSFSQLYQNVLFQSLTPAAERADETAWVASSRSWVDRKACGWFGICGLSHLNKAQWTTQTPKAKSGRTIDNGDEAKLNLTDFWNDARNIPADYKPDEQLEIPQYVLDHAPLIHLFSGEEYWPGDMAEHLIHTTPHLNYTPLQASSDHPNISNLGELNKWGRFVYLQSDDNVEDRPPWLGADYNIPNAPNDGNDGEDDKGEYHRGPDGHLTEDKNGEKSSWWHVGVGDTKNRGGIRPDPTAPGLPVPSNTLEGDELVDDDEDKYWRPELRYSRRSFTGKKVVGGRSDAPVPLVVVDKGEGVVDAFWFFFYSYNLGNAVFNIRFGNHVGDWEHTVIRFQHGKPKAVFFSEHSFGEAYTWDAVEKSGQRPIGFSATGTHAMYATAGVHPYVLPGGILHDVTDRGPLWDPVMNMYSYKYDYQSDRLVASNLNPRAPTSWFYFAGHWGDKFYPLSDPRQYRFLGQYHYVNGPLGPRFKNLGRQEICQSNGECLLKGRAGKKSHIMKRWVDIGEGEEMSEEDARRVFGTEYDSAS